MGVIIILALISLIVFPSIMNQIKKSKTNIGAATKKVIETGTYLYLEDNRNTYGYYSGDIYCVSLQTLVESGKLTKPIKDSNNKDISLDTFVKIDVLTNKDLDYELVETCTESNNTPEIPDDPNLDPGNFDSEAPHLYGIEDTVLFITDTVFNAKEGVTAIDNIDGDITDKIILASNTISLGIPGEYQVIYSVSDSSGNTTTYTRKVNIVKTEYVFNFIGDYQEFVAPKDGAYQIELWGAQGGSNVGLEGSIAGNTGGLGAYTSGIITLLKGNRIYIYVGGQGSKSNQVNDPNSGGYNGGGIAGYEVGCVSGCMKGAGGGGGATDIRINDVTLSSRIMVAAGGGGAANWRAPKSGANAGSLLGIDGTAYAVSDALAYTNAKGATQTAGGSGGIGAANGSTGSFAQGGNAGTALGGGGGGGYYGGGGGSHNSGTVGSGAGGSSFIAGYAGVNAISSESSLTPTYNTLHYSGKYFLNGKMSIGVKNGDGQAKITYLGSTYEKRNTKLNSVRYIKDCLNGGNSLYLADANWIELQAIKNGFNVAYGKTVTANFTPADVYQPLPIITDGNMMTSGGWVEVNSSSLVCVTVDLGSTYDLDEIAVWHYYADNRYQKNHTIAISNDNSNWTTVLTNVNAIQETQLGIRVSAYE